MTNTTIVTEPVQLQTKRTMQLSIDGQGAYKWTIVRSYKDGDCATTVTRKTEGEVSPERDQLVFAIASGLETRSACGTITRTTIKPSREVYGFQHSGNTLTVIDKTRRWAFRH